MTMTLPKKFVFLITLGPGPILVTTYEVETFRTPESAVATSPRKFTERKVLDEVYVNGPSRNLWR